MIRRQRALLEEQIETQRAQHSDTKTNGAQVAGTIRRQRELLEEQRTAFIRDAEARIAKMYLDGWITQKTLDDGLLAPNQLGQFTVNDVLVKLRQKAGMD